ncbi:MAG: sulfurtransferase, partial [Ekhidna sp.]
SIMNLTTVSSKWLSENLEDPDLIILDASEKSNVSNLKSEFPDLQIPKARYFDTKNSFTDKENSIPNMLPSPTLFQEGCRKLGIEKKSKIVVYDNLGIYNSPRVWWMFKLMGHKSVAVLNGGLPDWIKNKYKTEPIESIEYEQGDFISHFQPNLVKDASVILNNIHSHNFIVLDARSSGRFHATAPEPRADLKRGHIPDSINLPFTEVLTDGKLIPKKELEQRLSKLELKNKPLAFTCGSGITACIILLALETINNNPKSLYDGSWSEWGQLEGVPVNQ